MTRLQAQGQSGPWMRPELIDGPQSSRAATPVRLRAGQGRLHTKGRTPLAVGTLNGGRPLAVEGAIQPHHRQRGWRESCVASAKPRSSTGQCMALPNPPAPGPITGLSQQTPSPSQRPTDSGSVSSTFYSPVWEAWNFAATSKP